MTQITTTATTRPMPTTTNLRSLLTAAGRTQKDLAEHLGVSTASVSLMAAEGRFPARAGGGEARLREQIRGYLMSNGVSARKAASAFKERAGQRSNVVRPIEAATAPTPSPQSNQPQETTEDTDMLLRKHTITSDALAHFELPRDPFTNEMRGAADVFLNENFRKVRAAVRSTVQHGGLLAVIAESGAGKSTIRRDLAAWVKSTDQPVVLIEPYVIGMEETDKRGRPLRAGDIVERVIRTVSPGTTIMRTNQARQEQMHRLLAVSAQAHNRHVVIIEEAHRLATPTLRHLKNLYELDDGFDSLLSIVMIGQTELDWKLGDNNFEVREVVQRCEKRRLDPLDNDIEAYLKHKFARIGTDFAKLADKDVAEAVLTRLRVQSVRQIKGQRTQGLHSLCYPLAINNLMSGAINLAHNSGEARVSAKLVALVGREDAQ